MCNDYILLFSATPTYFKPYDYQGDGGIMANNPTRELMTEYFRYKEMGFERNTEEVHS